MQRGSAIRDENVILSTGYISNKNMNAKPLPEWTSANAKRWLEQVHAVTFQLNLGLNLG